MRQVVPGSFPSDDAMELARTSLTPARLSERLGIVFTRDADDLDELHVAAILDNVFGQVLLLSYDHAPTPGTSILVDAATPARSALKRLTRLLGLSADDLEWVNEKALTRTESDWRSNGNYRMTHLTIRRLVPTTRRRVRVRP